MNNCKSRTTCSPRHRVDRNELSVWKPLDEDLKSRGWGGLRSIVRTGRRHGGSGRRKTTSIPQRLLGKRAPGLRRREAPARWTATPVKPDPSDPRGRGERGGDALAPHHSLRRDVKANISVLPQRIRSCSRRHDNHQLDLCVPDSSFPTDIGKGQTSSARLKNCRIYICIVLEGAISAQKRR